MASSSKAGKKISGFLGSSVPLKREKAECFRGYKNRFGGESG